ADKELGETSAPVFTTPNVYQNREKEDAEIRNLIEICRQQDISVFSLLVQPKYREIGRALTLRDLSLIYHHELDFYKRKRDTLHQLDILRNLAVIASKLGNKPLSLTYIDEAQKFLNSINPETLIEVMHNMKFKPVQIVHTFKRRITIIEHLRELSG